ncbi:hypothetical protein ACVR1N_08385 [Streptococcus constellatus subsp. pharyngis]|uniref:hypothetical protein n=1 Tax=Streptococcus constellatus TaxID=76860 RepID=UPI00194F1B26|nr:hypothetical protein [Streptococcus constellatus]QRP81302.1 hypothetical protein I6J38_07460 [Streptococcus constellatus]
MLRIFLKDILDKKIVFRYTLFSFVLYFLANEYFAKYAIMNKVLVKRAEVYIIIGLCFSVFFFIRTYVKNDKIMPYYALPVSKTIINESFIISILIDTSLRKIIILMAIMLNLNVEYNFYVKIVLMLPGIVILSCIPNIVNIYRIDKLLLGIISIVYLLLVFVLLTNDSLLLFVLAVFSCFLYYVYIRNSLMKVAYFRIDIPKRLSKITLNNYFLKFFLAENVYIINTIGIVIMIIVITLLSPRKLSIPLSCAVGTINTPLLTIFSTEDELKNIAKFLPTKFRSLNKDYIFLIGVYFCLIQCLIMVLNFNVSTVKFVVELFIITTLEVFLSYLLEKKFPITNKKTIMEVWKNPRKYILTVIIFFVAFVFEYI